MTHISKRVGAAALVTCLLFVNGCTHSDPQPTPPCTSALGEAHINVGITKDQPGWGHEDAYHRSGFDYDFANWLAQDLCFTATYVNTPHAQRERMIIDGQVTLVISTFSKTDDRMKRVSFAAPYVKNQQGILAHADGTLISTTGDLNGKTVCTASGTTSLEQLKAAKSVKITIREEDGFTECVAALLARQVDAISTDQLILYGMARDDSRLVVVPDLVFGHQERYGIGFAHGDKQKCEVLTAAIKRFIANGHWDSFFGTNLSNVERRHLYKPDVNALDSCA